MVELSSIVALLAYATAVAAIDVRTHRIPNVLTAGAVVTALVLNVLASGMGGVAAWFSGLLVGFSIFLPFYLLRAFGAGDVKAMAAVGSFLGFEGAVAATAATLIAGGLIGICVMVWSVLRDRSAMHRLVGTLFLPLSSMGSTLAASSTQPTAQRFPYGTAIAAGTVTALVWLGHMRLPLTAS